MEVLSYPSYVLNRPNPLSSPGSAEREDGRKKRRMPMGRGINSRSIWIRPDGVQNKTPASCRAADPHGVLPILALTDTA